jgi:hypothetical protein
MMRLMRTTPRALQWVGALALACGGESSDESGGTTTASTTPVTSGQASSTGEASGTETGGETVAPTTGGSVDPGSEASTAATGETGQVTGETGETEETGTEETGPVAQFPGEVLDLTDWKLTLPIAGEDPNLPLEILQPELATYALDPYFVLADGGGVRFRAHAGGVTTAMSGYPRSELREMIDGGQEKADSTTTSGVHTMTITEAFMHLPDVKPHAVAAQIHDDQSDLVMVRLEGNYLFVEGDGDDLGVLDPDYQLGEFFTVRVRAADGVVDIFYEDMQTPAVSVARDATGCYFKAGVYTQSNPEKGDAPEAYGEVVITALEVTHE